MNGNLVMEGANLSLNITPGDYAANPTLSFGDGNDGIYQSTNNELKFSLGGASSWTMIAGYFASDATNGGLIRGITPTSTTPSFSFRQDLDTGIGRAGADILSLIAGGINAINITKSGSSIITDFNGNLSVDTDVLYVDSDNDRVGIGTSAPKQELNVVGSANVTEKMYIGGAEVFTDDSSGDMIYRI